MTKQEALTIYQTLNGMSAFTGVKFTYAIAKNLSLLKSDIEALQKSLEPTEEYQKFDKERMELVKKYAQKDEKGNPVVQGTQYVLEDEKAFDKGFEALKKKNSELVKERSKQLIEYQELLKTESTVVLHKVNLNDCPKELNAAQMHGILPIIEE